MCCYYDYDCYYYVQFCHIALDNPGENTNYTWSLPRQPRQNRYIYNMKLPIPRYKFYNSIAFKLLLGIIWNCVNNSCIPT